MNNKSMFGKYFKHVLVLTALAWMTYTLPSVRAALEIGYTFGSDTAAVSTVFSSSSTQVKPVSNAYGTVPTIKLYGTVSDTVTSSKLSGYPGNTFYIYGVPENLKNLKYGTDYTVSFHYPEKVFDCRSNSPQVNSVWIISCSSNYPGEAKIYMTIKRGERTYTSNVIYVSVAQGETNIEPVITVNYPKEGYSLENGFKEGHIANIQWIISSSIGNNTLSINLTDETGNIVVRNIASGLANTGSYIWNYDTTIPSGKYQIQIYVDSAKGGYGNTAFSGVFSIVSNNEGNVTVCPVGYICTPEGSSQFCPEGYVCTNVIENCPNGFICQSISIIDSTNKCYDFTVNLQIGSAGADVVALQTWLIEHGFTIQNIMNGSTAKGYYDQQTADALSKYQASVGISATGFFGPLTRLAVNSSCGNSTPVNCPQGYTCVVQSQ